MNVKLKIKVKEYFQMKIERIEHTAKKIKPQKAVEACPDGND
jgi:hypothetical protein